MECISAQPPVQHSQDVRQAIAWAAAAKAAARKTIQNLLEEETLAQDLHVQLSQCRVVAKWDPSIPDEIEVKTEWARLLEVAPAEPVAQQVAGREIWLIEGLFSAGECAALLEQAERHGFGATHYKKSYRGNLRLTTTDYSLAEAVWDRLHSVVPAIISCNGMEWDAVGLNECWRLAKYSPGDRFQGHCDGSFVRSDKEKSMFTVNVYMNEGFQGGCTRFFLTSMKEADLSVVPKTGLCLLFRQPPGQAYYHDGELLQAGVKYLFRSDVVYRCRD